VVESLSAQQDSALKDPDFSRNMPGVDTRAPAVSLPGAVAREEKAKQSIGFDPAEVSSGSHSIACLVLRGRQALLLCRGRLTSLAWLGDVLLFFFQGSVVDM
jgi:hypothetical protein